MNPALLFQNSSSIIPTRTSISFTPLNTLLLNFLLSSQPIAFWFTINLSPWSTAKRFAPQSNDFYVSSPHSSFPTPKRPMNFMAGCCGPECFDILSIASSSVPTDRRHLLSASD
ncbi:hypothetical protein J1614_000028 [Plenodomus biglobosus]|nr:hypothetical protein J1614_000028 [Plenodomus biglobosus]